MTWQESVLQDCLQLSCRRVQFAGVGRGVVACHALARHARRYDCHMLHMIMCVAWAHIDVKHSGCRHDAVGFTALSRLLRLRWLSMRAVDAAPCVVGMCALL
jgi:hypothetical protein